MPRVRLEDVAKHAGVSMKTVSNVVHDYEHVSDRMRTRVQTAIDELGYRPNLMGRRLATGRTGMLSLAFSNVSLPYFAELARVFYAEAERRDYRLLLQQTDAKVQRERAIVSADEAGLVDGLVFQPSELGSTEIAQHQRDVPLVLLGEEAAPISVDHVMIDNVAAATRATEHLIALGRRKIAFVGHETGPLTKTSLQRMSGYQNALEHAGIPVDMNLLLPTTQYDSFEAASAVRHALDAGLEFDALMCRDDLAAIGALRALHERGISVPGDVAITGWDNTHAASVTYPSLTSIAPDTAQLAVVALDMLEERIGGYLGVGRHRIVDFTLVTRESAPAIG